MIVLLLLAAACAAAATSLAFSTLVGGTRGSRASLARVAGYGRRTPDAEPEPDRHESRLVDLLARVTLRVAPGRERRKTVAALQAAGFAHVRAESFLALKAALAVGGLLVGLLLGAAAGGAASAICLTFSGAGVGFVLPDVVLRGRSRSRRE